MKDPRQGSYGVLAIVIGLGLRAAALAALDPAAAWRFAPAIGALSRAGMVWMTATRPPARPDGVGAMVAAAMGPRDAAWAGALACLLALPMGAALPLAVAGCAAVTWATARSSEARVGGVTGDVAGASQQLAAVGMWLGAAALASG